MKGSQKEPAGSRSGITCGTAAQLPAVQIPVAEQMKALGVQLRPCEEWLSMETPHQPDGRTKTPRSEPKESALRTISFQRTYLAAC